MKQEISSTQKLIEGLKETQACRLPQFLSPKKSLFSLTKNKVNIALDFRETYLLVCGLQEGDRPTLLFLEKIIYPKDIKKNTPEFTEWFKSFTKKLRKHYPQALYWILLPANTVKTLLFTIPRVNKKLLSKTAKMALKKHLELNLEGLTYDFQVIGKTRERGVEKLEIFAYVVDKKAIEQAQDLAKAGKLPNLALTSYQFSLADLFIRQKEKNIGYLFLGSDWSRIDIYNHGRLIFNREIKTGFISLVEELLTYLKTQNLLSPEFKQNQLKEITLEDVKNFLGQNKDPDNPLYSTQIQKEEILEALQPALNRLLLQIKRSLQYYISNLNKNNVTIIYFSSIFNIPEFILEELSKNLEIKIEPLAPITKKIVDSEFSCEFSLQEEMDFAPAIGACLDSAKCINFLLTSKDKKQKRLENYLRTGTSLFFIFIFLLLFIFHLQVSQEIKTTRGKIENLSNILNNSKPILSSALIQKKLQELTLNQTKLKNNLHFLKNIAILKELSVLTPKDIKWTKLDFNQQTISLEGVILLEPEQAELGLANYLLKLKDSPFIKKTTITNKYFKPVENQKAMAFEVELELK